MAIPTMSRRPPRCLLGAVAVLTLLLADVGAYAAVAKHFDDDRALRPVVDTLVDTHTPRADDPRQHHPLRGLGRTLLRDVQTGILPFRLTGLKVTPAQVCPVQAPSSCTLGQPPCGLYADSLGTKLDCGKLYSASAGYSFEIMSDGNVKEFQVQPDGSKNELWQDGYTASKAALVLRDFGKWVHVDSCSNNVLTDSYQWCSDWCIRPWDRPPPAPPFMGHTLPQFAGKENAPFTMVIRDSGLILLKNKPGKTAWSSERAVYPTRGINTTYIGTYDMDLCYYTTYDLKGPFYVTPECVYGNGAMVNVTINLTNGTSLGTTVERGPTCCGKGTFWYDKCGPNQVSAVTAPDAPSDIPPPSEGLTLFNSILPAGAPHFLAIGFPAGATLAEGMNVTQEIYSPSDVNLKFIVEAAPPVVLCNSDGSGCNQLWQFYRIHPKSRPDLCVSLTDESLLVTIRKCNPADKLQYFAFQARVWKYPNRVFLMNLWFTWEKKRR
ncbi:hypothetical protein HYH03_004095 [Edaphochlamys debaryana]|uniref:Bulb-type lectin domain-containing protein n=1 Tax=Edaphochlamys debaryana TaxID=47281 RepID=A0A835YFJ7_9CHLO|nr:hypothetical protein HYH03_004095 [Edaphochlamys debaryana]|eukprot:KAG2497825.1 hypothetical protein HYH03_004095 [Edaphochlamys debaryana]